MKKILISLLALFYTATAYADTCATGLMPAFTATQATQLCRVLGSSVAISLVPQTDNAIDLGSATKTWRTLYTGTSRIAKTSDILRVRQDPQRLFTWDASSDTALTETFGDGGVTAVQQKTVSASTADADDDSTLFLAGGGAVASDGSRGGYIQIPGEEVSGGGDITYNAGIGDTHIFQVAGTTAGILSTTSLDLQSGSLTTTGGASFTNTAGNMVPILNGLTTMDPDLSSRLGTHPGLVVNQSAAIGSSTGLVANGADANGAFQEILKTRATAPATNADTIVVSGDEIGRLRFWGADGATYQQAAIIRITVDGTPGTTDMPGAIDFQTSPDGSSTPASVLKLDNAKLATFTGAIKSTANTLGWVVRTGANTACTTTCGAGKGCAGGFDITGTTLVDCASAAADSCFCSF